jgi:hypothetical protein
MIDQVLLLLEEASAAGETRLQRAGKAVFRRAMEERTGNSASPDSTAQCILDAIVGYILRAYCEDAARVTPALLDEYRQRVLTGLEQGTGETRRLLQVLGRRTVVTDQALLRVQCLVENRFARWMRLHEAQLVDAQRLVAAQRLSFGL